VYKRQELIPGIKHYMMVFLLKEEKIKFYQSQNQIKIYLSWRMSIHQINSS